MRVFKTYFLILNRYKGTVFLYFAVFLSLALIMAKVNGTDTETTFEQERLDVAIVNEDSGSFGEDVKEYFGSYNDITTMEYDEEKITNALYWKRLDYVLVIPEGFSKELEGGKLTDLSCVKVPGYFDSVYFESELQMYLQKLQLLVQNGYTLQEAQKELMKLQEQETKVTLASFVNEKQGDISTQFFLYVPYLFIAVGVAGIGLVLLRLNGREVKERTECGALPMRNRVGGMVAAIAAFGILLYALVLLIDILLSKGSILQDIRLPWFLLNMFAMLLFGMSLGFFAGMVAKNVDAMNAILNVVSLVLCFLGGIFVPREWFAGSIGKIAKLVPTYWYVVNNEEIGQMTKATSSFVKNMLIQSGIVVAYAVVFFAVTLVIISARRKRKVCLSIFLTIFLTVIFLCITIPAKKVQAASVDWNVIALDPGHGGEEDGAYYYGKKEKDINYAIAVKVKQQLEAYEGVTVVLTRGQDEEVNLANRVVRAKEADADVFISLHCNASVSHKSQGASVYVSTGAKWRKTLQDFADCFLGEFEAIGLDNAGTFARVTQMGGQRADGTFDDYYGVLRHSYNNGIPALLVEHCYIDSEKDRAYVKENTGIAQLAQADSNAIAAFCGLKKADGTKVEAKHAKKYGTTTKARELEYYKAPEVTGMKLLSYDGKTPGIATYSVSVQDAVGITSMYLVYRNASGSSVTVPLEYRKALTTGEWEVKAYIPENMSLETYSLCYVGAYNAAGYDAGYNLAGSEMIGFGACDWLNTFVYNKEADLIVTTKGSLSTAHAQKIQYEIEEGLRDRHNLYPISYYPY